jgi:hypothetical protein
VGYLNQIQMGKATGMGVIGKNGLLIQSHYGARLMLEGVVTTADLPEGRDPEIDEPRRPHAADVQALVLHAEQATARVCGEVHEPQGL